MNVLGIDFTSRPSRKKPLTCLRAYLEDSVLRAYRLESWTDFQAFESQLRTPGPWIVGLDFPFGQARKFIETAGWPQNWEEYTRYVGGLTRRQFRELLDNYRRARASGDKEHRRRTDIIAGAVSPQKLYGVPVALMFFEGAPRLLRAGVTIPHLHAGDPSRIAVEAYPGVLARHLIGRRSYKNDQRAKQTSALRDARQDIMHGLHQPEFTNHYGFRVEEPMALWEDPSGDQLDALLCAVQAAWVWTRRRDGFGVPRDVDPIEGWISHPF